MTQEQGPPVVVMIDGINHLNISVILAYNLGSVGDIGVVNPMPSWKDIH